ncbi:hypothetical protein Tco_0256428 [Tanacetum coccineum]
MEEDKETAKLQRLIEVVPDKEEVAIDAIPLATKRPSIVDYKIHKEGKKTYYQIIRADGSSKMPEEGYERVLWGDLKTMFNTHVEDQVWRNQQDYRVLDYKLYDSCGVHSLRKKNVHIHMLVEKRYPLTPAIITYMLNRKLQAGHWNEINLMILKKNIKFRGGLLGLKDFLMILELLLLRILDKLDHMVKDFKLYEYNPGMETRIWSEDDRRRSKDFMEVIERRLKIRRIIRSLESFNIRVIPKYHSEDGNPARANIKQALGSYKDGDGVILFWQRQVHYRMLILDRHIQRNHESSSIYQERYEHVGPQDTRSQDGERPQVDDQRLDLADDLKEAQVHISSTITSHKTKITTSKYKISHEESKTTS